MHRLNVWWSIKRKSEGRTTHLVVYTGVTSTFFSIQWNCNFPLCVIGFKSQRPKALLNNKLFVSRCEFPSSTSIFVQLRCLCFISRFVLLPGNFITLKWWKMWGWTKKMSWWKQQILNDIRFGEHRHCSSFKLNLEVFIFVLHAYSLNVLAQQKQSFHFKVSFLGVHAVIPTNVIYCCVSNLPSFISNR